MIARDVTGEPDETIETYFIKYRTYDTCEIAYQLSEWLYNSPPLALVLNTRQLGQSVFPSQCHFPGTCEYIQHLISEGPIVGVHTDDLGALDELQKRHIAVESEHRHHHR